MKENDFFYFVTKALFINFLKYDKIFYFKSVY